MLQFAEHLITNAAEMWQKANLEQRQLLQQVLFPTGLTFQEGKFETATTCPLFNVLEHAGDGKIRWRPHGDSKGRNPDNRKASLIGLYVVIECDRTKKKVQRNRTKTSQK